jgi:hypothetical protein
MHILSVLLKKPSKIGSFRSPIILTLLPQSQSSPGSMIPLPQRLLTNFRSRFVFRQLLLTRFWPKSLNTLPIVHGEKSVILEDVSAAMIYRSTALQSDEEKGQHSASELLASQSILRISVSVYCIREESGARDRRRS